jgi:hypothetical protein
MDRVVPYTSTGKKLNEFSMVRWPRLLQSCTAALLWLSTSRGGGGSWRNWRHVAAAAQG